jgi:hypothetical protein
MSTLLMTMQRSKIPCSFKSVIGVGVWCLQPRLGRGTFAQQLCPRHMYVKGWSIEFVSRRPVGTLLRALSAPSSAKPSSSSLFEYFCRLPSAVSGAFPHGSCMESAVLPRLDDAFGISMRGIVVGGSSQLCSSQPVFSSSNAFIIHITGGPPGETPVVGASRKDDDPPSETPAVDSC